MCWIEFLQLRRREHGLMLDIALGFVQKGRTTVDAAVKLTGPAPNVDDTSRLDAQRDISAIDLDRRSSGGPVALAERRDDIILRLLAHLSL